MSKAKAKVKAAPKSGFEEWVDAVQRPPHAFDGVADLICQNLRVFPGEWEVKTTGHFETFYFRGREVMWRSSFRPAIIGNSMWHTPLDVGGSFASHHYTDISEAVSKWEGDRQRERQEREDRQMPFRADRLSHILTAPAEPPKPPRPWWRFWA